MGMTALAEIGGANPATVTTRHFAHDHLGSLRTAWGADRTLRARAEYLPYGEFLAGITDERIPASLFTGKSLDFETMLYHFPYRYYNPIAARWLTRDPLGMVDGPNVYAYVSGTPTNRVDDYGLFWSAGRDCGIENCNRPLDAWPGWTVYLPHLHHSYIRFGPGEGYERGVKEPCPDHKNRKCRKTRIRNSGTLPDGTPCSSASCDQIKDCIRNSRFRFPYSPWPGGNNCHSWVENTLKKCCLKNRWTLL